MGLVEFLTASASRPVLMATGLALLLLVGLFLSVQVPVQYLVRNLTVRWRTTLMTALAFVLVISLLTVMMAFVNGMYRLTKASGQPGNVVNTFLVGAQNALSFWPCHANFSVSRGRTPPG